MLFLWSCYIPLSGADHPHGNTLQGVQQHQYADIFSEPGQVDLSAHVDFSALRRQASAIKGTQNACEGRMSKYDSVLFVECPSTIARYNIYIRSWNSVFTNRLVKNPGFSSRIIFFKLFCFSKT